jgi:hypothetical protein
MPYAVKTDVPVQRTIAELDLLLQKYGATGFAFGRDDTQGLTTVQFRIADRTCRFMVEIPRGEQFRLTSTGRWRSVPQAEQAAQAEFRRRWRVRFLLIKALLVAVDEDAVTLTEAFLPHMLLAGGQTVAEWAEPQLADGAAELGPLLRGWMPALTAGGD